MKKTLESMVKGSARNVARFAAVGALAAGVAGYSSDAQATSFQDLTDLSSGGEIVRSEFNGDYLTIDGQEPTVPVELGYFNFTNGGSSIEFVGYGDNALGLANNVPGYISGIYNGDVGMGNRPDSVLATADFNGNGRSFDLVDGQLIFEDGEVFLPYQVIIGGLAADNGGMANLPASGSGNYLPAINLVPIPEPESALLVGLGLAGLAYAGSRRTRSA